MDYDDGARIARIAIREIESSTKDTEAVLKALHGMMDAALIRSVQIQKRHGADAAYLQSHYREIVDIITLNTNPEATRH